MNYWQGNSFMFPGAEYTRPEVRAEAPRALPTPEPVLPSISPTRFMGDREGAPEMQDRGPLGISDVSGGFIGNMDTIGGLAGLAVPGLGLVGNLGKAGLQAEGYRNTLSSMGFNPSVPSAMLNSASFGLFGQSIHDQAMNAVRNHAERNGNAGDTNAFGGKNVGRDSMQAREQGRGGAAPSGPDPAMGGMGGIGAAMGGRRGDGLRG